MKNYKVIKVIDSNKIVINSGTKDGLKEGDRVIIFRITDEDIIDKDTGKNYGKLEYPLGYGQVAAMLKKDSCIIIPDKIQVKRPSAFISFSLKID